MVTLQDMQRIQHEQIEQRNNERLRDAIARIRAAAGLPDQRSETERMHDRTDFADAT